jgi:hypothetical protein
MLRIFYLNQYIADHRNIEELIEEELQEDNIQQTYLWMVEHTEMTMHNYSLDKLMELCVLSTD